MDFIPLSQMIFLTSFWCTFSHENGSTAGCILACYMKTEKNIRNIILWFLGFADWFDSQTLRKNQFKRSLSVAWAQSHGSAHSGSYRAHNQNHHRQIASYFIFFFLLLTSPDNNIKVSDTTRKKAYMHIFTRVQAGTPQHQLPITVGPKRMRE